MELLECPFVDDLQGRRRCRGAGGIWIRLYPFELQARSLVSDAKEKGKPDKHTQRSSQSLPYATAFRKIYQARKRPPQSFCPFPVPLLFSCFTQLPVHHAALPQQPLLATQPQILIMRFSSNARRARLADAQKLDTQHLTAHAAPVAVTTPAETHAPNPGNIHPMYASSDDGIGPALEESHTIDIRTVDAQNSRTRERVAVRSREPVPSDASTEYTRASGSGEFPTPAEQATRRMSLRTKLTIVAGGTFVELTFMLVWLYAVLPRMYGGDEETGRKGA